LRRGEDVTVGTRSLIQCASGFGTTRHRGEHSDAGTGPREGAHAGLPVLTARIDPYEVIGTHRRNWDLRNIAGLGVTGESTAPALEGRRMRGMDKKVSGHRSVKAFCFARSM